MGFWNLLAFFTAAINLGAPKVLNRRLSKDAVVDWNCERSVEGSEKEYYVIEH